MTQPKPFLLTSSKVLAFAMVSQLPIPSWLILAIMPCVAVGAVVMSPALLFVAYKKSPIHRQYCKRRQKQADLRDCKPPTFVPRSRALSLTRETSKQFSSKDTGLAQDKQARSNESVKLLTLPADIKMLILYQIMDLEHGIHIGFHRGKLWADRCEISVNDESTARHIDCVASSFREMELSYRPAWKLGILGYLCSSRTM